MKQRRVKKIGFIIFNGIQSLDLFGPQESFASANEWRGKCKTEYETILVSEDGKPVRSKSGVKISPDFSIKECPELDTLFIPGGEGTRTSNTYTDKLINWLKVRSSKVKRIGSVCTGLFILAKTGILDGRKVTTHWNYVELAKQKFPNLIFEPDSLYIRDGKYFTAAGVTSGIDIALSLIEEDMGTAIASDVARDMVVFLKRPGGQNQYSSLLQQQSQSSNQFADLIPWIMDNLAEDLSNQALAGRVCLSERHFRRKFKEEFGETPGQKVERIKIETAKEWLSLHSSTVDEISQNLGFGSADTFRRAFERLTGITPSNYRLRFGNHPL